MKPFAAPLDDILFSLDHLGGAGRLPEWDAEFVADIAGHFAAFAEREIAPLDAPGDRQGCRLIEGRVVMPDGFGAVYAALAAQGWQGLTAPEVYGGQGMGGVVMSITSEIFSGACHSLQMVSGLVPGAIRTVMTFGTDEQKQRLIPPLASGAWLATMALTEPGAGSDLSRVRTLAVPKGDYWQISGEKIFISGGDQDMSDGILHLVLARTSDEGVRGLSLFVCIDRLDGTVDGARNAITVTRIEDKMGLHASPTCQLAFDRAQAEMIGQPGDGLKAMFTMMNHARLDVALQGVAHAARAHDVTSAYAADRVQGRGAEGAAVTLDQHADVRRMLDEIDALALGARAICQIAAVTLEAGDNPPLVEFLTPIAKVYGSDAGIKAAELGMQVLGGYGYLAEYRLEQTYRDARIAAIYEGANGIHARALAERLLRGSNAVTADAFEAYLARLSDDTMFGQTLAIWREGRVVVAGANDPTPLAHDFMALSVDTMLHGIWLRYAQVADQHKDPARLRRVAQAQIRRITAVLPGRLALLRS